MQALGPTDPTRIGGYRLRARLGGGGMGAVFLGTSPGGRPVAVKVVSPELADDPEFRARFAAEVQLARRVNGFCTAPVVDADPDADRPWLATLYLPAPSLLEAVREQGPLPVPTARILAAGLAEALVAIHGCGIVHRDLKPSNVLLAPDGPRVIDFGIARALDGVALTQTGAIVGSPGDMAPEYAEGGDAGPAADMFALGATVGYAVTGRGLFGNGEPQAVLYRVVRGEPDLSAVPEPLRPLLRACLEKDPAVRPPARVVLGELAPAAQSAWQGHAGWLPAHIARLAERQSTALLTFAAASTAKLDGVSPPQETSEAPAPSRTAAMTQLGPGQPRAEPGSQTRGTQTRGARRRGARTRKSRRETLAMSRAGYGLHPWPKNGMGTSSLVLGIVGMVLFFGPGALLGMIGVPLAIGGIWRAHRRVASNRGVAIAGLITSLLAIVISLSVLDAIDRWAECARRFPTDLQAQADCRDT